MLQAYFTTDGLRALIVLLLALGQIFSGARLDRKRDVHRNSVHNNNLDTPLIPWGPFFAIWLVIFAACLAFAVWQFLPGNLTNPYLQAIGWPAAAIFLGASAWQIWVPKYSLGWASLAIILFSFLHALLGLKIIGGNLAPSSGIPFWLGVAPILFTGGWLSLVAFANLSATLVRANIRFDPRSDYGASTYGASTLLLLAGFVVASIGFYSGSYLYIGAAIWGLIGIIIAAAVKKRAKSISGAAGFSILVILLATLAST